MHSIKLILLFLIISVVVFDYINCYSDDDNEKFIIKNNTSTEIGRELIEQGRTLVHHAVKRFMVIMPAIFFKLGVAFTLLLLVAIVAVNNGFIGFLILVVGLSSVLSRLQEPRKAISVPVYAPAHIHGHPYIDRRDKVEETKYHQYPSQNYDIRAAYPSYIDRKDVVAYNNQISKLNDLVTQQQQQQQYGSGGFKNTEVVYGKYIAGK